VVGELLAVRDLDAVRPGAWPEALRHLASEPLLRRALLATARVSGAAGLQTVPGLTSWWLGRELRLGGTTTPGSDGLDGLLDEAPGWVADLDPEVRAALGVVDLGADRTASGPAFSHDAVQRIVDALADPDRKPGAVACLRAWRWLALAEVGEVAVPQEVRVLDGAGSRLVSHDDAIVADDPRWLQRDDLGGLAVAPAGRAHALADLLDLDLASERAGGRVTSQGVEAQVPDAVRAVLPTGPAWFVEHDELLVDGQPVDWWVDDGGTPHAATTDGLARALAWAVGKWDACHLVAHVLADPSDAVRLAVEDAAG